MSEHKTIRCKTKCGLTVTWRIGKARSGKFKALSLGKAKAGRDPVPLEFVPFELSNAVLGSGIEFATLDAAENYVRSL